MRKLANVMRSSIFVSRHFGGHSLVRVVVALASVASGCGGGSASAPPASNSPMPGASAPAPVPPASAASAAPSAAPSTSALPSAPAPSATSESKPSAPDAKDSTTASTSGSNAAPPEPSVPASEILTAPKVAFLIDYANSEAREKALAACDKEPKKDDPSAKSACMQKARSQFQADVLVFQKDKKDHVTLTIYKRNDSELKEVLVAPVAFANVTGKSLQLKFKGGSGQRPIWKTVASPTLNLPNDYTVEIDDAEYGKLRYEAKVGLVDK